MTDEAQALMIAKLQIILHRSLVEIRNLSLTEASQQVYDLADAVEFLPLLVLRSDEAQAEMVRSALAQYEAKYPASAGRYTGILDMEAQLFDQLYRPRQCDWESAAEGTFAAQR
jgi:hypothetical protein